MRFLQPGRSSTGVERPETASAAEAKHEIASADSAEASPVNASAARADGQPRPSEGVRILLERIDLLTSRLLACEETIRQLEQTESELAERHAEDRRDLEERLRRQVERQFADLAADMEQRQKGFAAKQAKLLELLASEISKVRSIAETGGRLQAGEPAERRAEPHASRRRTSAPGPELDFFDTEGGTAAPRGHGTSGRPDRHREEFEFWDWLEELPPEPGRKPADDFDMLIDLDENDLK
jgi:hypothetical protein